MIGQNDGVLNEKNIVTAYNGRLLKILSAYQQKFIKQLYPDIGENDVIHAKPVGGSGFKPDIEINVNRKKYNISVKKGSGNSIHQEKTDLFIRYCTKYLGMTSIEKESLLLFLYGDGTIDGNSSPEERLSDDELLYTYKNEIDIVQKFLNKNKRNLIERFLIYGRLGMEMNIKADYIYHGDATEGVWCPLNNDTIDYLVNFSSDSDAPLTIGPFTLQVWNRNLKGNLNMEDRRHSIQIKWAGCKKQISDINDLYIKKKLS